ncbi:nuclease, EndA/NucM family [Bacteriovorax sp. BAL6_X]|uniref:endonuclease I family protein n=1 Tax=Bacteriovorax sp. BAL6_X TaxID=1201290 RepID=UPI0003858AE3|nr:endonuclease [Bacteriovorax sp. BAL6_X]EPZ50931.1 nuclease, EndA/NucM family [Bacteriovorax sp. BAL6_X]
MTKLSHLLVLIYILTSFNTQAAYSSTQLTNYSYYPEDTTQFISRTLIRAKKNSDLNPSEKIKEKLREIIISAHIRTPNQKDTLASDCTNRQNCFMQRTPRNYKEARKYLFGDVYLQTSTKGLYVKDIYCNQEVGKENGVGRMQIPNHQVMNCEHSWPQSRFNPRENRNTQKNDLHHLFPANSRANSSRSNHPFGEVNGRVVNSNCQVSHIGEVDYANETTTSFEPPEEIRGNIARALFYFSTRYNLPIDEAQEFYLRKWHNDDPVDAFEEQINNRIFEIQNSRNPFIDDETLVDAIKDF